MELNPTALHPINRLNNNRFYKIVCKQERKNDALQQFKLIINRRAISLMVAN